MGLRVADARSQELERQIDALNQKLTESQDELTFFRKAREGRSTERNRAMFASLKKQPFIKMAQLSTLIAEGVEITGDLLFTSGMRIDGRVKGDVTGRPADDAKSPSLLVLSANGHIEGSVRCGDAVINGTVVGDLDVEHRLELQSDAHVTGTIRYRQLQMDVGATVQGHLLRVDDAQAVGRQRRRARRRQGRRRGAPLTRARAGSLHHDARVLDELGPLRLLVGDEAAELGGAQVAGLGALGDQVLAHVGHREHLLDVVVQPGDDRRRRRLRREQAEPALRLVAGQARRRDGRQVGSASSGRVPVTAIAFSRPDCSCGITVCVGANISSIWPPSRSVSAWPVPL